MVLNDIIDEIKSSGSMAPDISQGGAPDKVNKKEENTMTKEEKEKYKERKMREEENKYLKNIGVQAQPIKRRGRKPKAIATESEQQPQRKRGRKPKDVAETSITEVKRRGRKKVVKQEQSNTETNQMPKMLQPLQPLYLFKIPGLPEGDCLAICLVHGAIAI